MIQPEIRRSLLVLFATLVLVAPASATTPGGDELDQKLDNALVNVRKDRPWHTPGGAPASPAEKLGTYDPAAATLAARRQARWTFSFTPYIWVPGEHGTIKVKGQTADIDLSIGEAAEGVVDNFKFAAMGRFEADYCRWSVILDLIYVNLGNDDTINTAVAGPIDLDWDTKEVIAAAFVGYRFAELPLGCGDACFRPTVAFDALAGARLYYESLDLDLDPGPDVDDSKTWVDPVVGLRTIWYVTPNLAFNAMGTIGGFGVGSDLSWSLLAGIDWRINNCFWLNAGWAVLDIDYENGDFAYDVRMSGPYLGATFRF